MEKNLLFFIVLAVIFLLLTVFLKLTLNKFNSEFQLKLNENEENAKSLYAFSYDIHLNTPQDSIVIDNPYNCTATDLRLCDVNDPLSCVGCKSLISTCVHFDKDTKYIDYDGVEYTIAANANDDEGYCLTQLNPLQACNPYHGDLVFIQTEPEAIGNMLYCECKNPGYIGKTQISGACDEVFICNGNIDDINKPLNEINCVCENDMVAETNNDIPTCVKPQVKDFATGFDDPFFYENVETVDKSRFINGISGTGKFPGKEIINPCKYCLLTGEYIPNGKMVQTEDDGWQCVLDYSKGMGIPVRRSSSYRVLKGAHGADAIINLNIEQLYVHGYVNQTQFEQMTAVVNTSMNMATLTSMGVDTSKSYVYIDLQPHELVFPESFGGMTVYNYPGIACTGVEVPFIIWDDFSYSCDFVNTVPYNRNPAGYNAYFTYYNNDLSFQTGPECPPKAHGAITSSTFKEWKEYEGYNSAHSKTIVNKLIKYEISQEFKNNQKIKYIFSVYNFPTGRSTHYGTSDLDTYNKWFAILIPKN